GAPGRDESLLDAVARIWLRERHSERKRVEAILIAEHELLEGGGVPAGGATGEPFVRCVLQAHTAIVRGGRARTGEGQDERIGHMWSDGRGAGVVPPVYWRPSGRGAVW